MTLPGARGCPAVVTQTRRDSRPSRQPASTHLCSTMPVAPTAVAWTASRTSSMRHQTGTRRSGDCLLRCQRRRNGAAPAVAVRRQAAAGGNGGGISHRRCRRALGTALYGGPWLPASRGVGGVSIAAVTAVTVALSAAAAVVGDARRAGVRGGPRQRGRGGVLVPPQPPPAIIVADGTAGPLVGRGVVAPPTDGGAAVRPPPGAPRRPGGHRGGRQPESTQLFVLNGAAIVVGTSVVLTRNPLPHRRAAEQAATD